MAVCKKGVQGENIKPGLICESKGNLNIFRSYTYRHFIEKKRKFCNEVKQIYYYLQQFF